MVHEVANIKLKKEKSESATFSQDSEQIGSFTKKNIIMGSKWVRNNCLILVSALTYKQNQWEVGHMLIRDYIYLKLYLH